MALNGTDVASEIQPFMTNGCSIVLPQGFQNTAVLLSVLENSDEYFIRFLDGSRCLTFSDSDCKLLGFKNTKNLTHLTLPNCSITSEGLEFLIKLPFVRALDVQKNRLGPEVGKYLNLSTSLTDLKIGGCSIGESSILNLAKNTSLRYASLRCANVKQSAQIHF
jgi:hypothetical protein